MICHEEAEEVASEVEVAGDEEEEEEVTMMHRISGRRSRAIVML